MTGCGFAISYDLRHKITWSPELPAAQFHAVVFDTRKPAVRMLRFDWLKILHVLCHPFAELPAAQFHAVILYSGKPPFRVLRFDWLKILHVLCHPFALLLSSNDVWNLH
jgi:hypothetical protein